MNILSIVSLLFAAGMLSAGLAALGKYPKRKLNQFFFIFALVGAIWAFTEFGYRQAEGLETAVFWLRGSFIWVFAFPLVIHWILHLSLEEKILKNWLTNIILYVPAAAFAVLNILNPLQPVEANGMWTYLKPEGVWFDVQNGWVALLLLITLTMAIRHYLRETEKKTKRQGLMVLAGVFLGMLPILFDLSQDYFNLIPNFPSISTIGLVFECGFLYIALTGFEKFKLTPFTAMESILSTLTDAVILTTAGGTIVTVNNTALEILGYKESEIVDQPIGTIVGQMWKGDFLPGEDDFGIEMALIAKDQTRIPISLTTSAVPDTEGIDTGIVFVARDLTKRLKAQEELVIANKEKEVLLKEIHHRVKNNLQVISSLLSIQTEYVKDEHAFRVLEESRDRVFSMAVVHELLYQSENLREIDFADYIERLVEHIVYSNNVNKEQISFKLDISGVALDLDTAGYCGLIITELVSNSLFHAFPGNRQGAISVVMRQREDGKYVLAIKDNGVGLPPDFKLEESDSLGLQLVNMITEQLGGEMMIGNGTGAAFTMTFEKPVEEILVT